MLVSDFFSGGNSCVPSVTSDHRSSDKFPIFFSAKFLRPFSSKRTEFERQIRQNGGIPDVETLQKKILEELKKDDVKKKINSYFREGSKSDLKNKLDIFDGEKINSADELYKKLSEREQFEKIFKLETFEE